MTGSLSHVGYDVLGTKLVMAQPEAEGGRHVVCRYVQLGCRVKLKLTLSVRHLL